MSEESLTPLPFPRSWLCLAEDLFPDNLLICSFCLRLRLAGASEGWQSPRSNHLPASWVGSLKMPLAETLGPR